MLVGVDIKTFIHFPDRSSIIRVVKIGQVVWDGDRLHDYRVDENEGVVSGELETLTSVYGCQEIVSKWNQGTVSTRETIDLE